jgi:AcrR family transcriptional regulator
VTSLGETSARVASILEAACRVVVRDGSHRLRMASVAAEAGVSKALVHYYFSTKGELLRSAFAWSDEQWQRALTAEIEPLATARERVERLLVASIAVDQPFSDQRALWNEVWSSLRFDDEIRPLVDTSYRAWLRRLAELIEDGHADGSIASAVNAEDAAWRLAAIADGLDSMLYLGLLDRERAVELVQRSIRNELVS